MCFPVPWQQPAVVAVVWDRDCTFCGLGGGSKQQQQPRADLVALRRRLKNVSAKLSFSEVWRQAEGGSKLGADTCWTATRSGRPAKRGRGPEVQPAAFGASAAMPRINSTQKKKNLA